ncbi:MAG: ABC transporter permease subunit [Anaerobacillus sp.]
MLTISLREFRSLFKSVRSIIIILFIFGVTLGAARLISQFNMEMKEAGLSGNAYMGGLVLIILTFGPLFVTSLSHQVVNGEVHSRTIRFLATKTSRENIVLGKFLGTAMYWIVCILIASLLVIPFAKAFFIVEFVQAIIFVLYFIGLTTLLSTSIQKPSMTMFLGIVISIAMPVLGTWGTFSNNVFLKVFSYLTPYFYYFQEETWTAYFVIGFPILFLLGSLLMIRRRDF